VPVLVSLSIRLKDTALYTERSRVVWGKSVRHALGCLVTTSTVQHMTRQPIKNENPGCLGPEGRGHLLTPATPCTNGAARARRPSVHQAGADPKRPLLSTKPRWKSPRAWPLSSATLDGPSSGCESGQTGSVLTNMIAMKSRIRSHSWPIFISYAPVSTSSCQAQQE